eukprot:TRINITY_DN86060_c0_g1_i1.p1 TRINITY_DN86060_c0_g1~~TRINITY_DN86060_c0_g1_i1.p1  ORF type:complete len:158 (+),score=29.45 TRINITY_DN86060_c0_g1_i1:99-572(+)
MSSSSSSGGGMQAGASSSTTTEAQANQTSTPILHLLLQPRPQHSVTWAQDTVDNEHMNKKKSKKCCIYSKPREFGESSSESEGSDDGAAKPSNWKKKKSFCPFGQSLLGDPNGPGSGSGGGYGSDGPSSSGGPSSSSSGGYGSGGYGGSGGSGGITS